MARSSGDREQRCDELPEATIDIDKSAALCSGCGGFIANCAWIDINLGMVMNAESGDLNPARFRLPAPEHRLYRMSLALPHGWRQRTGDAVWRSAQGVTHQIARTLLEVSGYWNPADLGREAMPPLEIECPHCSLVQFVGPRRRRGLYVSSG